MKKFFFFCLLLFPVQVLAGSITNLEVLNGTLSREFDSNNNVYSVVLNDGESTLKLDYVLEDQEALVTIEGNDYQVGEDNVAVLNVTNSDGTKESYTFYLEKEEIQAVFEEVNLMDEPAEKKIAFLEVYVGIGCFIVILILFKVIILGFSKKKRRKLLWFFR